MVASAYQASGLGLGPESAIIRSLTDLAALKDWTGGGAKGTFVADCRITSSGRPRG
jgi:hypothetical protein